MATTYKTPGAYVEEIAKLPPSIAAVDTAIPAFIGYTAKDDLKQKPTRIESLADFEAKFGGPDLDTSVSVTITETAAGTTTALTFDAAKRSKHILYYSLQLFYANGGKAAYIVSAGAYKVAGGAPVEKELEDCLAPLAKFDEPTLIVIPEAQALAKMADYLTLNDLALKQCKELGDRFLIIDARGDATLPLSDSTTSIVAAIDDAAKGFRSNGVGMNNLSYGAAYAPYLTTVLDLAVSEGTVAVTLPVPPGGGGGGGGGAAGPAMLDSLKTTNNRYYELAKTAIRDEPLVLPPSGAMAGIYARVDNERGVWKAPANVSIVGVVKPTIEIPNSAQDVLNVDPTAGKSVNAIRAFTGKGTLVWGARTLAGNDNEWRYVNVRRFFIFAEESIQKAVQNFTFEPNDANTWVKVQAMIENFLTTQWRSGALQGIKPEHAFYVSIGLGKTMTALDILEGRMIVEIGMAALRPAEFIVLRFSHKMAES